MSLIHGMILVSITTIWTTSRENLSSVQTRSKTACSATETRYNVEILLVVIFDYYTFQIANNKAADQVVQ